MKNHWKLLLGLGLGIVAGTFAHDYQDLTWLQTLNQNLIFHLNLLLTLNQLLKKRLQQL
jgi:Na+/H+-dicarboxylate symporter